MPPSRDWNPTKHPVHCILDRLDRLREGLRLATYHGKDQVRRYRSFTEVYRKTEDILSIECVALSYCVHRGVDASLVSAPIRRVVELIEEMTALFPICEADIPQADDRVLARYSRQFKCLDEARCARRSLCRLLALSGEVLPAASCRDSYLLREMPDPYAPEVEDLIQDVTASKAMVKRGPAPAMFPANTEAPSKNQQLQPAPLSEATGQANHGETPSDSNLKYTADCSTITYHGVPYVFGGRQRPVMQALVDAHREGTPGVSQAELLNKSGTIAKRLSDIFKESRRGMKTQMHPAWKTLVVQVEGKKDVYCLNVPLDPVPHSVMKKSCEGTRSPRRKRK